MGPRAYQNVSGYDLQSVGFQTIDYAIPPGCIDRAPVALTGILNWRYRGFGAFGVWVRFAVQDSLDASATVHTIGTWSGSLPRKHVKLVARADGHVSHSVQQ